MFRPAVQPSPSIILGSYLTEFRIIALLVRTLILLQSNTAEGLTKQIILRNGLYSETVDNRRSPLVALWGGYDSGGGPSLREDEASAWIVRMGRLVRQHSGFRRRVIRLTFIGLCCLPM